MEYRTLGQSGIEASAVAFGAWAIGGWMWGGTNDDAAIEAIHAALDSGVNFIDTAPIYGFGHSERVVGKALEGRRDRVVLATKCGMVWETDKGRPFFRSDDQAINEHGDKDVHIYLHPDSIRTEVERSLKYLNTDYIDLLQTHWQEQTTPIEDTMAGLLRLKDEGKIRAIGVCNASVEQMERYRAVGPLDVDQEKYSMLDRDLEREQLPYCKENNIAVLAYSPLANGLLTGRITPDRQFNEGDLRNNRPRFSVDNRQRVLEMLEEVRPIAAAHNITLAQLAIAWTLAQPGLTHALVGARNPQQARENAAAGHVQLSEDELKRIEDVLSGRAAAIS